MKYSVIVLTLLSLLLWEEVCSQSFIYRTYHDVEKKKIKTDYRVKDSIHNWTYGAYTSYFPNGNIESKGQFKNNIPIGMWYFFYEKGTLKMEGPFKEGSRFGIWKYYRENGQRSMEGSFIDEKKVGDWSIYYDQGSLKETGQYDSGKRHGLWKKYWKDGTLLEETQYSLGNGHCIVYYRSGKKRAMGSRLGVDNTGHWKYFAENGSLRKEGDYVEGKKNGKWLSYYPSGEVESCGMYEQELPAGDWVYFFENGTVKTKCRYAKSGQDEDWIQFDADRIVKTERVLGKGWGEQKDYYSGGQLKAMGRTKDGQKQGKWAYLYEDGQPMGECDFDRGRGVYYGYYPDGSLKTKGIIEEDIRIGSWELYRKNGSLSGYYKSFHENKESIKRLHDLINKPDSLTQTTRSVRKASRYFTSLSSEYKGFIIQGNPIFTFLGFLPLSFELYNQERLGYEFLFEGIRNPFFQADNEVEQDKIFTRGYAVAIRQKFYNPLKIKTFMFYFGHEIRLVYVTHSSNMERDNTLLRVVAKSDEKKIEYGLLVGMRLMENTGGKGITIDAHIGFAVGHRDFVTENKYQDVFSDLNQGSFSYTFRFGINVGYVFSMYSKR